jgi:hypothetical protein
MGITMERLGLYAKCDTEKPAVSSPINPLD